ncbi:uncharacterized protein LOC116267191 [Nymphaea colorata]|nr:uncharacterized protein LOC116267191 [Nymphaea colorata]
MRASSPMLPLLLLFLLSVAAELGSATYYTGRQKLTCWSRRSRCFLRTIRCPAECPLTKPSDPKAKACYLDCNSPKCEAMCRNRKADCHGTGAACYDPRFVGGDGVVFFFHGKANEHFSLVSDTNLQINARFIGLRPQGRTRDFTWIQALGFMYGSHTFSLGAKKAMKWDNSIDQLEFFYDGQPIFLSEGHLSEWSSPDHDLKLERTARTNSIIVKLPEIAEVSVNVVPVTKEDDRIHKYQIPADDCFAHLEVQFRFYGLSPQVEGVIGKTYQPDFQSPVKKGVAMPIMGGEDKYRTPSLLSPNCKFCKFKPETKDVDHAFMAYPSTIDCATKLGNGAGMVCRK